MQNQGIHKNVESVFWLHFCFLENQAPFCKIFYNQGTFLELRLSYMQIKQGGKRKVLWCNRVRGEPLTDGEA